MKAVNWFDNKTCRLIIILDHATRSSNLLNEFYCALIILKTKFAIRKSLPYCSLKLNFFSFDDDNFQSTENSKFSHHRAPLANYRGKALVTGCSISNNECGFKTEIMDMTTLTWSNGPDYPYGER